MVPKGNSQDDLLTKSQDGQRDLPCDQPRTPVPPLIFWHAPLGQVQMRFQSSVPCISLSQSPRPLGIQQDTGCFPSCQKCRHNWGDRVVVFPPGFLSSRIFRCKQEKPPEVGGLKKKKSKPLLRRSQKQKLFGSATPGAHRGSCEASRPGTRIRRRIRRGYPHLLADIPVLERRKAAGGTITTNL